MAKEIMNTYDQLVAVGGGVAIIPSHGGTRTQYFNGWAVWRVGKQGKQIPTDPSEWRNNGKKVFRTFSNGGTTPAESSRIALDEAKQWIADQGWHSGEWARNRMRDYVPTEINKKFPVPKRD